MPLAIPLEVLRLASLIVFLSKLTCLSGVGQDARALVSGIVDSMA